MGLMKALWDRARGKKKPWNTNQSFRRKGSAGSKILEAMCNGQWMSAGTACELINSHKGQTRLQEVRKMLKHHGILHWVQRRENKNGRQFKEWQIMPIDRERARSLIVGKA